jgi:hypothetical protein
MKTAMNLGSYLNSMRMNSEPMVDESLLSMRTNSAQNSRMFLLAMYPALVRIPFSILSMHSSSIDLGCIIRQQLVPHFFQSTDSKLSGFVNGLQR